MKKILKNISKIVLIIIVFSILLLPKSKVSAASGDDADPDETQRFEYTPAQKQEWDENYYEYYVTYLEYMVGNYDIYNPKPGQKDDLIDWLFYYRQEYNKAPSYDYSLSCLNDPALQQELRNRGLWDRAQAAKYQRNKCRYGWWTRSISLQCKL